MWGRLVRRALHSWRRCYYLRLLGLIAFLFLSLVALHKANLI